MDSKICTKCKIIKTLDSFTRVLPRGRNLKNRKFYSSRCRACKCEYVKNYSKTHPITGANQIRWMKNNPEKKFAHERVMVAVRRGDIKRLPCEVCGEVKTDGHHDDYSKPLEVRWLCRKHHKEHHLKISQQINVG